ncbi:MAG TPA: M3 family oligoendopeptidase [Chloroflexota bacterium]|nr:M3 family oligoendopeptidase [Chloroflexota bacterium]
MSAVQVLPRWDVSTVFPSLDSPEFRAEYAAVIEGIGELADLFGRVGIERISRVTVDQGVVDGFETAMSQMADLLERVETLFVYIYCFVATNSKDDAAQAVMSELQQNMVRFGQLQTRFTAWIGSLDVEALINQSSLAREHAYMLRRAHAGAEHLMPQSEEDLASELDLTGGTAWSRLHSNITSQLMVTIEIGGESRNLPMSAVRNLAMNPDRGVRRAAYEAELAAWKRVALPLAAALNSIKGETNTLDSRRRFATGLDVALFNNDLDRETLDAMLGAARDAFPDFRRYLHAKARALGLDRLAWYDIFAPLGETRRAWEWDDAVGFMLDQFGQYSPRLRSFAEHALTDQWIDAEPREGKQGGAFCIGIRPGESRVLTNFTPSYDSMSTLAHELGHAYHNFNLASRSVFQREAPMTLAETASIFCETIVQSAALRHADAGEQLMILEAALQNATQVVVDITSRFEFEKAVFEARRKRELSIDELNGLMLEAEKNAYGDGLDESTLHPYMWAVKGHYYNAGYPFYNFPYMFGLLFGLGLFALYQQDPEGFQERYDRLLSSTGTANAAALAGEFGFDIRSRDFWTRSLDIVRRDIDRFEELVDAGVAG